MVAMVQLRKAAQLTLPEDIRKAARLQEGDCLEAEVTPAGDIVLRRVSTDRREPTSEEEAEILAVVDQERKTYAAERGR